MKKLFTLLAFLTCFLGANAKEVVDVEIDFSTYDEMWKWGNGWIPSDEVRSYFDLDNGCFHFHLDEAKENNYDIQLQPFPGTDDTDAVYTVTVTIKGTVEQNIWFAFGGSNTPGDVPVTTDWQTLTFTDVVNDASAPYFANSGTILLQCGHYVGDFWISYLKITHDEKEQAPVNWINFIENGDASAAWANPDAQVVANAYEGDGAETVCAYSKEYGYNDNNPHAAFIEDGAFYTTTQPCEDMDGAAEEWQNQFWINFPRALKDGEHLRLSFDYKASEAAQGAGQGHRAPGDYLGGWGPGTIDFTTEWQTYTKEFDASADCHSIAFNLGGNGQFEKEITFYFDNIKLEYMELEEGWFVAATDTEDGDPAYDFDNAISFEDAGDGLIAATVGGATDDEWVNQIMISTAKGNDKGFKGATIKVDTSEGPITNDPEDFHGFEAKGKTVIDLPVRGQWTIYIDEGSSLISFKKIAGEEDKPLLEIIPNPTSITLAGTARVAEDWDNQFWIAANRDLAQGEEILIEFDYYMESDEVDEAATDIQAHNVGADGNPTNYQYWGIDGVPGPTFTTEVQHYSKVFTVSANCNNMRSICFNMAKVEAPVNYTIENVVFMLNDRSEYLVDPEDEGSFAWRKIGRGGAYQYPAEPEPYVEPEYPKGDVNKDNEVGVGDLIAVSNYMAEGEESGYTFEAANVNEDEEVGVGDLITISNIMAGAGNEE
jgi:hypothetical protein